MNIEILLPALVAAVAGVLATASHRRLRPEVGARLLAVTMVAVVVAVVPAIMVLAFGFLAHLPWFGGALSWCRETFGIHQRIPDWLGVPAVLILAVAVRRLHRVRRSWRRFRCTHSDGIQIVSSAELFAYTMPGPGGHIVVSDGLVDRLDAGEMAVVVAHEQAHARHRHDRFVLVGSITVALLPLIAPLERRLRFALERWADEATVETLDVERTLVARTVASVALSGANIPTGALGIGGLGVAGRVTALLEPPPSGRSWLSLGTGALGVISVLAAAVVQAHHMLPLLVALCPG
jgi:Zn-dependent protease with chaperone function